MEMYRVQMLAAEAGFVVDRDSGLPQPWITGHGQTDTNVGALLVRFAELVAAKERQACVAACEAVFVYDEDDPAEAFKDAINARGEVPLAS